ncbi:MAG: glycosyltransferase, partial [Saprospiraceae bacterium]
MPLKTAFLVPYPYLPATSGGRVAAAGFSRALAEAGGLSAVISAVGNEPPEGGLPYPLHELLPGASSRYVSPNAGRRVLALIDQLGVECLIVQQPFLVPLLLRGLRRRGVRVWVWSHNLEYRRFRTLGKWFWPIVRALERFVYRRADRVLFISRDELPVAIREFNLSPARCAVLPFGTDLTAPPAGRAGARKRGMAAWDLHDRPTLLFFGRLSYEPNLAALD